MYQRERLFSLLGSFAYTTFVEATRLCRSFRHQHVELEHWLSVLVNQQQGDIPLLFSAYDISQSRVADALKRILHTQPNHAGAVSDLSLAIENAVERGVVASRLSPAGGPVRTIHILLGILQDTAMQRVLYRLSDEFKKLPVPKIFDEYLPAVAGSVEQQRDVLLTEAREIDASGQPASSVLERWCTDLTAQAAAGEIDPVVGRDRELFQLIDILQRRRQNNPMLVGEAGVGKTAVVEALACQIAAGSVPLPLQGARLLSLDLGRMQAGAHARGEFEARLKSLTDAIRDSGCVVVLFCDEAHTLVGAGGQAGTGDAVNLLKPMLARGELRMIGATTWSEYKQFIEPDAALTRRFQPVTVSEPDEERAVAMLRAIAPKFSAFHQVTIRESALLAAVRLSQRNLPARQLPDKAIGLLDTACVRVARSQHGQPQAIVTGQALLAALRLERDNLLSEKLADADAERRLAQVQQQIMQGEEQQAELLLRHQRQQQRLQEYQRTGQSDPAEDDTADLFSGFGDALLVWPWVDERVVAEVLSDWTGIPSGRMLQSDIDSVLQLESRLSEQIFGQPAALKALAQTLRIACAGLQPADRPTGVFMLAGPTGCGKTATAGALARAMYGGEQNLIAFNMSEFQEAHSVSTLKGAPPGYVGYGRGGKLTEAVRRKPWSVILLDEFDKAHPDVHDLFYQAFDKGGMEDAEGRQVSFRHAIFLLTCNAGSEAIEAAAAEQALRWSTLRPRVHQALQKIFPAALLARWTLLPYVPLTEEALCAIAAQHLAKLGTRLLSETGALLTVSDEVARWLAARAALQPSSGRAVEGLLNQTLLPAIGQQWLQRQRDRMALQEVRLRVENDQLTLDFI